MNNVDRLLWRASRFVFFLTLLLLATCSISCRHNDDTNSEVSPVSATNPRPVQVFVVPDGSQLEKRSFPVFVKGGETAKLSFRIPGKMIEFNGEIGTRYNAGDVVAKLDPRDYQLAVDRADQAIVEAQAALSAMETGARAEDVDALEAALEAAKSQLATAKRQYERMDSLRKDGAASEVQYDLAKTAYDGAVAAELAARKNLEKANKGSRSEEIEMMKAKIEGLKIDRELAANKLEDTKLIAPFSGVVSEKFYDNHESAIPGLGILTLVDDASFEGELSVSEEFVARQGDIRSIVCTFESLEDKTFTATLKQTSSSVQKGNRSYLATLKLDATPEDGLLVGMVGVATMELQSADDFVLIPVSALIAGNSEPVKEDLGETIRDSSVWVVDKETSTVVRRGVKIGVFVNGQAQVLEGLKGGEAIVSAGARFLVDGQKVAL